jgi:hypothetical protein
VKVFVAVRVGTEEMFDGVEGELVRPARPVRESTADRPGFIGIASGRASRYARVADLGHVGHAPFRSVFFDALVRDTGLEVTNDNQRRAMESAEQVLATADTLDEGAIVMYDGWRIRVTATR